LNKIELSQGSDYGEDIKDKLGHYLRQQKAQKEVSVYLQKLKEKAKVERFLTEDQ